MRVTRFVLLVSFPLIRGQETVLGTYIFHRNGDRTTKSFPPTHLTDLGYAEVYQSGNFYRSRYLGSNDSSAATPIFGVSSGFSSGLAVLSQLSVQSPVDDVLQNSATGFLQGLYPAVGTTLGSQTLGNGSTVEVPLGGYQLIPVNPLASASSASPENSIWLEGASGCQNAIVSSNNYFLSQDFISMANQTASFYQSILPVISGIFTSATDIYKNAYASLYIVPHLISSINIVSLGLYSSCDNP
jgi:hypothetical protein